MTTPRAGTRTRRRALLAPALTVLALSLAACGNGSPDDDAPGGDAASSPSDSSSVSSSPPPSPSPTPTPPAAKDGTNLDACLRGTCEVAVSQPTELAVDESGALVVSITEITADAVAVECSWSSSWEDSDGSGSSSGAVASIVAPGQLLPCDDVHFEVMDITGGTAIIAISPA